VCRYFILPESCKPCLFYLRNLLYLIVKPDQDQQAGQHIFHVIRLSVSCIKKGRPEAFLTSAASCPFLDDTILTRLKLKKVSSFIEFYI